MYLSLLVFIISLAINDCIDVCECVCVCVFVCYLGSKYVYVSIYSAFAETSLEGRISRSSTYSAFKEN